MTEYEELLAWLNRVNLPHSIDTKENGDVIITLAKVDDLYNSEILNESGNSKVSGYSGFCHTFKFSKGTLIESGSWE